MKYFRMSYEEVVFNRSYLNILLLNRSIPSFDINTEDKDKNAGKSGKTANITNNHHKFKNETELFMSLM